MKFRQLMAVAAILASLTGCERAARPVSADAGRPVVAVDGTVLTRGQLDARVELMLKLARRGNPRLSAAAYLSLSNQLVTTYPKVFVPRVLAAHYAAREQVEIPPETLRRFQQLALRRVSFLRARSYDALLKALGADAELFDGQVREEALVAAVKAHVIAANPTNLPPDYAAVRLAEIRDYNARMAATNRLIHARAKAVWRKLKAGEPFEKMVEAYTELPEERADKGEWGLLDRKLLEDSPALLRAVSALKPGEFSAPVEGDNGLMIARLDEKNEQNEEYSLSRIYFHLPMYAREAPASELIAEAQRQHGERVWAETLAAWEKQAKIEYFDYDFSKKETVK
ncbi:MAG: peptidylprolyl isomerase [Kiritimatiellia bacterium]